MADPLATVVVPAYNAGAFLRPAVVSVLGQAAAGLEVVVVDDGSTDGSVDALSDLPVRTVRGRRSGEGAARNAGVRAARGRYVGFLDADDLLAPGALAPRLEWLERNASELAVGGLPRALIDDRGAAFADVFERMSARRRPPFRLSLADYRAGKFFPVSCSLYLYRREAFARAGGFDESLPAAPDADFHFRLLALGDVTILRVATFDRRLHGANMSLCAGRAGAPAFRPEVAAAIRAVNARHGIAGGEIVPWENEFL